MESGTDTGTSRYAALAEQLRRSIRDRACAPGDLLGSEHDLARREGMSRMTVRKASDLLVREGLIERRPGKGLFVRAPQTTTQLIQVVVGNLQWEPCLQVAVGVKSASKDAGMQVQLYDANGDADLDLEVIRNLAKGPARGAVIVSFYSSALNEALYELVRVGFPFVLVDQRLHDIEVSSVMSDNLAGGYEVGRQFVERGHQRIGFVGDLVATTVQDRLAGLRDAMGDAGLPFDRSLVVDLKKDVDRFGDWSGQTEVAVRELLSRPNPPTAIFGSCDAVARAAIRTASTMGVNVPQDLSVAGFDDDPLAQWVTPSLSTVRQNFQAMGQAAVELLTRRMTEPTVAAEHRSVPVEWIERGSVQARRVG